MFRLSPALFAIVLSTTLLAQSSSNLITAESAQVAALRQLTVDCDTFEHNPDSQVPRIFARPTSTEESSSWIEFENRAAWTRAGSPKPVALVWYWHGKLAHVRIAPDAIEPPDVYVDYCYRDDGRLSRIRPTPRVQRECGPSGYECSYVLRMERLYPRDGAAVTAFTASDGEGFVNGVPFIPEIIAGPWLQPERTELIYVPMTWPEYKSVADLPFNQSLYATSK